MAARLIQYFSELGILGVSGSPAKSLFFQARALAATRAVTTDCAASSFSSYETFQCFLSQLSFGSITQKEISFSQTGWLTFEEWGEERCHKWSLARLLTWFRWNQNWLLFRLKDIFIYCHRKENWMPSIQFYFIACREIQFHFVAGTFLNFECRMTQTQYSFIS